MDKQIIKRIINERQQEVLERQLVERPQLFERGMNYVLACRYSQGRKVVSYGAGHAESYCFW